MVAVGIGLQLLLLAPRKRQKERVSERERERAINKSSRKLVASLPPKNMMKCRVLEMQQLMLLLLMR